MNDEPELCAKPLQNAKLFTKMLGLPEAKSAIVPLIIGENDKAVAASKILAENGFLVAAIRPPTVPENTARLRFTFSALHEHAQIEKLCDIIKKQELL
jgi:8-amino-7-oxononanoate synthase